MVLNVAAAGMVGRSVDPQMTVALTAQIICHIGRHLSSSCCSSFMESDGTASRLSRDGKITDFLLNPL